MTAPRPIVIVGPTAGGKSDFAVALAEALRGRGEPMAELINADSMQVYRGMEAGTAKPQASLRERAVHHLIDVVEPSERFTVADWLKRAEPLIESVRSRGVRPIIVGGTNLYLRALLEGMFEGPEIDATLRDELGKLPGSELHRRLALVDPPSAQRIHPNDIKKLVRALEVFQLTGKPISAMQTQWGGANFRDRSPGEPSRTAVSPLSTSSPMSNADAQPLSASYRHDALLVGLEWPVDAINKRINARVKEMFFPPPPTESLPDEVRRLEAAGLLGVQAREALGYKQVLDYLAGLCTLDEAFEKTKILTRRFAKSQRTWLKRYRGVLWLPASDQSPEALAEHAANRIAAVR